MEPNQPGGVDVDDGRLQELERKRDSSGLTDDEANELGRILAEREGKPYGNASTRPHPESIGGEDDQPYSEAELQELRKQPDVREG
jgi:hypothetical protein